MKEFTDLFEVFTLDFFFLAAYLCSFLLLYFPVLPPPARLQFLQICLLTVASFTRVILLLLQALHELYWDCSWLYRVFTGPNYAQYPDLLRLHSLQVNQNRAWFRLQCVQHSVHCTAHSVHCTIHSVHCTTHSVHCTTHIVHCTAHSVHCTTHSVHCTTQTLHCTVHRAQCLVYSA